MIVMKFGGSSVANAERLRHVADIVKNALPRKPVLVLSAMGDTTDHLLEAAEEALKGTISIDIIKKLHKDTITALGLPDSAFEEIDLLLEELNSLLKGISLIKECTERTNDYLVSFGERMSIRVAAAYFNAIGIKARALDAWDAGFISNGEFGSADVLPESWDKIRTTLCPVTDSGIVPVITGFIAKDMEGNITTLGRGGSDLSATLIGSACKAEEVQVWKDVDGILTADPRVVKAAHPVDIVSYEEAAELAYFGAQVLHPRSMYPCISTGMTVRVKNSYNPSAPGTRIVSALDDDVSPVRAITSKKDVTLVDIVSTHMLGQSGFLAGVFNAFAERRISVDMVATSEVSISLTLDTAHDLEELKEDLEVFSEVEIKDDKAIVTIIGDVRHTSDILKKAFGVCSDLGIQVQMLSQGASKVNISFIVDDSESDSIVQALHAVYFEGGAR